MLTPARESASISLINHFLSERARVSVYDPEVKKAQMMLDLTDYGAKPADKIESQMTFCESAIEACKGAEAVVVATEWDEFKNLDWTEVYKNMSRPAFVFDGRLILDRKALQAIGFKVVTIGTGERL